MERHSIYQLKQYYKNRQYKLCKSLSLGLLIGLLSLLMAIPGYCQQVVIIPLQASSELFFFDQLFQLNVMNSSSQQLEGFIEIDVQSRSGQGLLQIRSSVFSLASGRIVQSNEIDWGGNIEAGRSRFITSITETGRVPYGEYTVCYRFIGNAILNGQGQVLGLHCSEQRAKTFGQARLVSPYNTSTIHTPYPILTWQAPLPLISQDVYYSIRLVGLNKGQSVGKALRKNPPLLAIDHHPSTFLTYPISGYPLEENKRYAWQVEAFYAGIALGKTMIWTFQLAGKNEEKIEDLEEASYRFVKPQTGASYYLAEEVLHFAYYNRKHETVLSYIIYEEDEPSNQLTNLPTIALRSGVNMIDLDGGQLGGIEEGKAYVMQITDAIGEQYYFKFKYQ